MKDASSDTANFPFPPRNSPGPGARMRKGRTWCGLLVAAIMVFFLQTCAPSQGLREYRQLAIDEFPAYLGPKNTAIVPHSVDFSIPDVDILKLSDDMRAVLDKAVLSIGTPQGRLEMLLQLLISDVRYDPSDDTYGAKTAIESFEARSANSLSFASLFIAMARYAGLSVKFEEIPVSPTQTKSGNLIFGTRDIGVLIIIYPQPDRKSSVKISFTGGATETRVERFVFVPSALDSKSPDANPFSGHPVPDRRAFAQYYNSIGVKYLAAGDGQRAFRYFVKAVKTDPSLSLAWSNLGVSYLRNHQTVAAEKAYLQALSINPGMDDASAITIMGNLGRLYRNAGMYKEAAFFENALAKIKENNPFYQFSLGKSAYANGRYEESILHFKKAIRKKEDEPMFYYAMALTCLKTGDVKTAEDSLQRAESYAWTPEMKSFYHLLSERLFESTQVCTKECIEM